MSSITALTIKPREAINTLDGGGSSAIEQEMEDMSQLDCSYNTKQEDIHSFFFNLVSLSVLVALF